MVEGNKNNEEWPIDKFDIQSLSQIDQKCAVLLITGAMNPIHNGHIEMMNSAKRCIESEDYSVLGGFISASHDDYIGPKMRRLGEVFCIPGKVRNQLVKISIADSPWIEAGLWESKESHSSWPSQQKVLKNLSETVYRNFGVANITLFYVCGQDHFERVHSQGHNMKTENYKVGMVATSRSGTMPCDPGAEVRESQSIFFAQTSEEFSSVSSTRIREELSSGCLSENLVHPDVRDFLQNKFGQYVLRES